MIAISITLWADLGWAAPEWFCPCPPHLCPCGSRTGAGFMDAWGTGLLSGAVQPATSAACDSSHACEVTTQGTITAQTFFGAGGEIGEKQPWVAIAIIDFAHPMSSPGAFRTCYPIGGQLSVTDSNDSNSSLVFYFQGQGCQAGTSDLSRLLVTASYILTGSSTGRFAGVSGIGSINIYSPTGLLGDAPPDSTFPLSLSGNLHFPPAQPVPTAQQTSPGSSPTRAAAKLGTSGELSAPKPASCSLRLYLPGLPTEATEGTPNTSNLR
jgi:hypothetical protein